MNNKEPLRKISSKISKTKTKNINRTTNASTQSPSISSIQRFKKSMAIDYEKWHDGIGYDLEAIKLASPSECKAIEQILIHHSPRDWRDIEALAQIDTVSSRKTIKNAMNDPDPDVRIAVTRFAPNSLTNSERSQSLIKALESAEIFGGPFTNT